jgi:hypothetical protein
MVASATTSHRTRCASASVGAQIHCARTRTAHTLTSRHYHYLARRAYTLDSPIVPTQGGSMGWTRTHTHQLSEKVLVHIQPSYCSYYSYCSYGSVSLYAPPPISPHVYFGRTAITFPRVSRPRVFRPSSGSLEPLFPETPQRAVGTSETMPPTPRALRRCAAYVATTPLLRQPPAPVRPTHFRPSHHPSLLFRSESVHFR